MNFLAQHIPYSQMVDLAEGRLSSEDEAAARTHLAGCEPCTREVQRLERLIAVMRSDALESPPNAAVTNVLGLFGSRRTAPTPSLRQRLVASLRFDSGQSALALGVRSGQPATRQLLFNAGGYDIDLRIAPSDGVWTVSGQMLGSEQAEEVELSGSGTAVRATVNALGEFALPPVPSGTYQLVLHLAEADVEIQDLHIESS